MIHKVICLSANRRMAFCRAVHYPVYGVRQAAVDGG